MTKAELIAKLKELAASRDKETAHSDADFALLDYINDREITAAYCEIKGWCA